MAFMRFMAALTLSALLLTLASSQEPVPTPIQPSQIAAHGAPAKPRESERRAFTHTIYLVRHGAYDMEAKVDPEVGGPLTPLGIVEARLVGARLRGLPLHFDSIVSSTMERARETAAILRESLPEVELRESPDLSECRPPPSRPLESESAEKEAACGDRLDRVFLERFRPATTADQNDLVVTHGNVIRYLVTRALGVDTRAWLGFSVAHASLTVIRVRPEGTMRVVTVGDIGHIPPNVQSWGTPTDPQLVAPTRVDGVSLGGPRASRPHLTTSKLASVLSVDRPDLRRMGVK